MNVPAASPPTLPHGPLGPRPPAEWASWLTGVGLVVGLLLVAAAAWWLWRRAKTGPGQGVGTQAPSPEVLLAEARAALWSLSPPEPFDAEAQGAFAFALSEAFKRYWERRRGDPVTDKTSEELAEWLARSSPCPGGDEALAWLRRLDAVKFAGRPWSENEARQAKDALMGIAAQWGGASS